MRRIAVIAGLLTAILYFGMLFSPKSQSKEELVTTFDNKSENEVVIKAMTKKVLDKLNLDTIFQDYINLTAAMALFIHTIIIPTIQKVSLTIVL